MGRGLRPLPIWPLAGGNPPIFRGSVEPWTISPFGIAVKGSHLKKLKYSWLAHLAPTRRGPAGSEPMDEGQANGHGPAGSSQDPTARAKKMTIIEITAWLTEHGKEEVAYNLANKKAKKAEYVNAFVSAHS